MRHKLECTSHDMDYFHSELHKLRKGTRFVAIEADTLSKLLRDHAELLTAHKGTHQ